MIIQKAIEILQNILTYVKPGDPPEEHDAIKLGIEALKRVRDYKKAHIGLHYTPMPGETEE